MQSDPRLAFISICLRINTATIIIMIIILIMMMIMIIVGAKVGRKLGYQAFAGCMRSYLTPGANQQIIIIVDFFNVINHLHRHQTLRIPGNLLPGACRPSLCLGAGHSSDTGETIFDTDGLAPPVSEKKTPHHQSPRPLTEKPT